MAFVGDVGFNGREVYFKNETLRQENLTGWLPMPTLDDEGNVT